MSQHRLIFWWHVGFATLGTLLIVLAFAYLLWAQAKSGNAARTWASAPGVVLWSRLVPVDQAMGTYASIATTMTVYFPDIEYSFHAGREWRGTTPFLMQKHFVTLREGEEWLQTVLPNTPVRVWYDPADPTRSALVNDKVPYGSVIILALTGVAVIGAGWLFTPF